MVLIKVPSPHSQFVQLVRYKNKENVLIFVMVLQKGSMHFLILEAGGDISNEMCMVLSRSCWEACTSSSVRLVARCDASY